MPATLTQVIVANSGGKFLQVYTQEAIQNPAGCASPDGYVLRDPAIVDAAIAVALAAQAGGRPVRVYAVDSCDAPTGRPLITIIGTM